jgi:hypothetical protein
LASIVEASTPIRSPLIRPCSAKRKRRGDARDDFG